MAKLDFFVWETVVQTVLSHQNNYCLLNVIIMCLVSIIFDMRISNTIIYFLLTYGYGYGNSSWQYFVLETSSKMMIVFVLLL